ncbi:MAG: hypothetical protein V1781_05170 [Bacteroidota bacterium]
MTTLNKNWITEKHIDFEYKKYLLLSYLQEVKQQFSATKLYPWLSELIEHYRFAISIRENKINLRKHFPQQLSDIDINKKKLSFKKNIDDDMLMQEIENIVSYAILQFEQQIKEGKAIYDFIENHLSILPVGIVPLSSDNGYIFLKCGEIAGTNVYEYQITIFENIHEKHKAIHTQYVKLFKKTFFNTFESIKCDLIQKNKNIPNPATYAIETDMIFPLEETFLPIAKRMLVKHLFRLENKTDS